jgi:phosphohistidine phosphatase SixA
MRLVALLVALAWPVWASADDWDALDRPGAFAIMRHALAPGTGDPANFELGDCDTQRNLDARGRAQAAAIGAAFRDRGQVFDTVLSSRWCRCLETAEAMAIAPVEPAAPFDSFFQAPDRRVAQTEAALALLQARGGRVFVVTHFVNIRALTGVSVASGEVLVVRHAGDRLEVLGSILIEP